MNTIGKSVPMDKRIINIYRCAQVSMAINMQYLNHLSVVCDKVTPVDMIEKNIFTQKGRRYSEFNIVKEETIRFFEMINILNHLNLLSRLLK